VSPDFAAATMKFFDSKTSGALAPEAVDGLPEGADGSPETGWSVRWDAQAAAASNDAAMIAKVRREGCRPAEDVPITALHHLRGASGSTGLEASGLMTD
jgi:hypothetical protein